VIDRLLVANRGEIALRVFRTCRRLGIETVAVVAPDDGARAHARAADTVVEIASYLDPLEHLRAAAASGAAGIHPGYGFLSESADFAAAVAEAGLTWIGPPAAALRLGGNKLAAKRIAIETGVPVLPQGSPAAVGLPLLVKAAAGGGGRGMRVVRVPGELDEALAAAAREAEAAFGDPTVFCERYLERPRHVEVQLLADDHGTVLTLPERDCSVQRRHQKVVEETPAPLLSPGVRSRLFEAAEAFARAIGYRNAGTAEFLVAGEEVVFLELNGRIQVEHPVTEAVTGLDLVEQQLRIAAGEHLATVCCKVRGHAVEARVYAEDPRTFLPQAGRVRGLRWPGGVRVDAGIEAGDEVPLAYDPMLAKLIAHGTDRDDALARLAAALEQTDVDGVVTNLPFLRWLVAHPAFRAAELSTAFLVERPPLTRPPRRTALGPWRGAWRLNLPAPPPAPPPARSAVGPDLEPQGGAGPTRITAPMPGLVLAVRGGVGDVVAARAAVVVLEAMKMEVPVTSPFGGTISALHVAAGDTVAAGDPLFELR
jgi:acetyl/propionyl-CoA carboxylase alpha subunit